MAASIWTYQGQLNWNRFNVMLVANSVIVAVISALLAGQNRLLPLVVSLAALGFVLCVAWVP